MAGLIPSGAFWYVLGMSFFGSAGLTAHILGMVATGGNDHHSASQWFLAGTFMWIGAFVVLGFFIGPITKAKHRR